MLVDFHPPYSKNIIILLNSLVLGLRCNIILEILGIYIFSIPIKFNTKKDIVENHTIKKNISY